MMRLTTHWALGTRHWSSLIGRDQSRLRPQMKNAQCLVPSDKCLAIRRPGTRTLDRSASARCGGLRRDKRGMGLLLVLIVLAALVMVAIPFAL